MVQLVAQFGFVDLLGQHDVRGAVDQREGHLQVGVEAPDHLQHEQFIEVRIEQAANDRIEFPGVIVDALGEIDRCHRGA